MRKLVCFFVGDRELAAPIEAVRETVELRLITPLFRTPPSIAGLMNLRGEILAVLDPAPLLGLAPCRRGPDARIVVVEPDGRAAGLLVDALGSLRVVSDDGLRPVPAHVPAPIAGLLEGVLSLEEQPVAVLDPVRLLGAPQLAPFVRAPEANHPEGT